MGIINIPNELLQDLWKITLVEEHSYKMDFSGANHLHTNLMNNKVIICILLILIIFIVTLANNHNNILTRNNSQDIFVTGEPMNYVEVFSKIYHTEHWGKGKGSGDGSIPENAQIYIKFLQNYFHDPKLKKIVDLGCGDWQIMSNISIPDDKEYRGYDVAKHIITKNEKKFSKRNVKFFNVTNLKDFVHQNVNGDLLIVKDVLQHLPISEIKYFITNVLPNFKYALITNEYEVASIMHNKDIKLGEFRSLGMLEPPFKLMNAKVMLEYDGPGHKQILLYKSKIDYP